jgi:hypothetical protein
MSNAGRNEPRPTVRTAGVDEEPCPACGSSEVLKITMQLEGAPVSVRYCAVCDTREWSRAGAAVDLDYLLPAMRTTTRRRG